MATTPGFANTPEIGSGIANATLDTSLTAPTNATVVLTAASSGTRIDEIIVQGLGTTVAAVCNIFAYDGTTYHLIDQILITAVTSSTTAVAFRASKEYRNLVLKSGWSLRMAQTIAGNQSLLKFTATGADY